MQKGKKGKHMKILLVGAGAVGQVYGRHLQAGGAQVSFLVKEKYAKACREGLRMYPLNQGKAAPAQRLEDLGVLTDVAQAAAMPWDQVWLCTSSTALAGPWLETLLGGLGDSLLVALQPGVEAVERIAPLYDKARTVWGGISMISYQAPLKGEEREEGVAYWFPPMSPSPFWGPEAPARQVVAALKAGGCPAAFQPGGEAQMRYGSAVLMTHLVALEANEWSFAKMRTSPLSATAAEACREVMVILAKHAGEPAPAVRQVVRPWLMSLVTRMAPCLVPLPLETYFEYHFTKVGDQTRAMIEHYLALGKAQEQPTRALGQLAGALGWGKEV